jgi:hypothetical protein
MKLIANHPALSKEIAHAMGIPATAWTIKLFWGGAAEIIFATTYAISVAIPVNAASVGNRNSQTVLRSIAPKRHGMGGNCRKSDSSGN